MFNAEHKHSGMIEVLKPGLLTTVQDLGRPAMQPFGVSVSGAMDTFALRIGNLLLGNEEGAAALEATLVGPALQFEESWTVAITGGDLSPCVDGKPAPMWRTVEVPGGAVLSFGRCRSGCRAYITFAGGIEVPRVMDSAATYLRGRYGGLEGRALKKRDRLRLYKQQDASLVKTKDAQQGNLQTKDKKQGRLAVSGQAASQNRTASQCGVAGHGRVAGRLLAPDAVPDYQTPRLVRVIPGPHEGVFAPEDLERFYSEAFTISPDSDRMGYRLTGSQLLRQEKAEIISGYVTPGSIQVPTDGHPILMMADSQVSGGYPILATVISVDLPYVAQRKPGDCLRFQAVSLEKAQALYMAQERLLMGLRFVVSSR